MQPSPITNAWGRARTTKVDAEHFLIFRGRPGMGYNHHQQITSLDGRLFATWSDAPASEDEPGQHMVVAVSDDHGETWSTPRALVPPQPGVAEQVARRIPSHFLFRRSLTAHSLT